MLTLLTGKPGNGKGVYLLDKLLPEFPNRRIFVWGMVVNDKCPYHVEFLDKPEDWYKLPDGAVIVIDECQKVFPPRSATSQPPKHAAEFAEHRHRGHDIILITQDPKDIDAYVRRKVGRHIHLKRATTNGERATVRTLMNDVMDCDNRGWKGADKFEYLYNKDVYQWYHSSEIHTHKRRLPRKLIYAILLLSVVFAGYSYIGIVFNQKTKAIREARAVDSNSQETGQPFTADGLVDSVQKNKVGTKKYKPLTTDEWLAQFKPRVEGMPWSAPIYDDVNDRVVNRPIPTCVASETNQDKCICHSQQGTRMDVSLRLCRDIAINGFYNSSNNKVNSSFVRRNL